jgi:DNA modification methylase
LNIHFDALPEFSFAGDDDEEGDGEGGGTPGVSKEAPVSLLATVYQLGPHRLLCGDGTDFGQVSELLNGGTVDLVLTDPPYGIDIVNGDSVGGGNVAETREYSPVIGDDTTDTAKAAWETIKNLGIKKSIIFGGNYFTDFLPPSPTWIIWDKRGDMSSNNFADCELAWSNAGGPARSYTQLWNGMIREGEHDDRVHPTQKPVRMLGEIIKEYSDYGHTILDLFGGSGSTLIAADKTGRKCLMAELDPAYCDVIRKRYQLHMTGSEEGWEAATPAASSGFVPHSPTPDVGVSASNTAEE